MILLIAAPCGVGHVSVCVSPFRHRPCACRVLTLIFPDLWILYVESNTRDNAAKCSSPLLCSCSYTTPLFPVPPPTPPLTVQYYTTLLVQWHSLFAVGCPFRVSSYVVFLTDRMLLILHLKYSIYK